jgi:hypothetical protein
MRSAPVLAAAAFGAVAVITGCGQQHAGTGGGGAAASTPSAASRSAAASPGSVAALAGCHGARPAPHHNQIVITNADNGRALCVRPGTAVLVYLKDLAGRWAPIQASSAALEPRANGRLTLMRGVTGASFQAAGPGTAVISSFQDSCGPTSTPGNAGSGSGTLECGAILDFRVTVRVES